MWRRAYPLLTAVLAVALVLTRRRLSRAQAELERMRAEVLERMRAEADAARMAGAEPVSSSSEPVFPKPTASSDGAEQSSGGPARVGSDASDISSEWEQAVPPMDS